MPHIYPLQGQKHNDLTQELTTLGGTRQETFRLAFAWDGEHYFEVTENDEGIELYEKWIASQCGEAHAQSETTSEPSTPATGDTVKPATPSTTTESPTPVDIDQLLQTQFTTTLKASEPIPSPDASPQPRSTEDRADVDVAQDAQAKSDDAGKPASSNTGTTRKRSAKNSNRRS
jgi:hypothetical protein